MSLVNSSRIHLISSVLQWNDKKKLIKCVRRQCLNSIYFKFAGVLSYEHEERSFTICRIIWGQSTDAAQVTKFVWWTPKSLVPLQTRNLLKICRRCKCFPFLAQMQHFIVTEANCVLQRMFLNFFLNTFLPEKILFCWAYKRGSISCFQGFQGCSVLTNYVRHWFWLLFL